MTHAKKHNNPYERHTKRGQHIGIVVFVSAAKVSIYFQRRNTNECFFVKKGQKCTKHFCHSFFLIIEKRWIR